MKKLSQACLPQKAFDDLYITDFFQAVQRQRLIGKQVWGIALFVLCLGMDIVNTLGDLVLHLPPNGNPDFAGNLTT